MSEESVEPIDENVYLPQLLTQVFTRVLDGLTQRLLEEGYTDVRATHVLNVFRVLDWSGTRPTEMARRAGMTSQSMSELVGHLERGGYLQRVPDPNDGRGRIVTYADRGRAAAAAAIRYFADVEAEWAELIGARAVSGLRRSLSQIAEAT